MTLALTALEAAAGPILIVLGISAIGFILGKEEVGLLPPAAMKNLSKLTTVVFLPCFFFTKLSANVNMARVFEWWTLPFFVALNMLFGILLGRLLVHFQGHRMGGNRGVVLASCTLGSVGHLPLVLALAACSDGLPKFHLRDGVCKNDAIAMVSFGLWIMTITLWSLGGYLIKCFDDPPAADPSKLPYAHLEEKFDVEAPKPFSGVTDDPVSASTLRENQPHENEATTRAASTVAEDLSGQSAETKPEEVTANKEDDAGKSTQAAVPAARAVPMRIKALSYINPPIAAIFLGLLVGTVPALRGLLLGTSAPLALVRSPSLRLLFTHFICSPSPLHVDVSAVTKCIDGDRQLAEDVGGAAVPCMLLVLGASMRLRYASAYLPRFVLDYHGHRAVEFQGCFAVCCNVTHASEQCNAGL